MLGYDVTKGMRTGPERICTTAAGGMVSRIGQMQDIGEDVPEGHTGGLLLRWLGGWCGQAFWCHSRGGALKSAAWGALLFGGQAFPRQAKAAKVLLCSLSGVLQPGLTGHLGVYDSIKALTVTSKLVIKARIFPFQGSHQGRWWIVGKIENHLAMLINLGSLIQHFVQKGIQIWVHCHGLLGLGGDGRAVPNKVASLATPVTELGWSGVWAPGGAVANQVTSPTTTMAELGFVGGAWRGRGRSQALGTPLLPVCQGLEPGMQSMFFG